MPIQFSGVEQVTPTIQQVMETAMNSVKTEVLDMVGAALPIALAIGGTFMAIRIGWSFFRSMAH